MALANEIENTQKVPMVLFKEGVGQIARANCANDLERARALYIFPMELWLPIHRKFRDAIREAVRPEVEEFPAEAIGRKIQESERKIEVS